MVGYHIQSHPPKNNYTLIDFCLYKVNFFLNQTYLSLIVSKTLYHQNGYYQIVLITKIK